MPELEYVDMSNVSIVSYTDPQTGKQYPANTIPKPKEFDDFGIDEFYGKLKSIRFPESLVSIEDFVFMRHKSLEEIEIPSSVQHIGEGVFAICVGLECINIPEGIQTIKEGFIAYTNVKEISIPSSITRIEGEAFDGTSNLKKVYSYNLVPPVILEIDNRVFTESTSNEGKLYVPAGFKETYQQAEGWKDFKNIVEIAGVGAESHMAQPSIAVYPKPFTESVILTGIKRVGQLTVTDMNWRKVMEKSIADGEYILLNHLPQGVYLMEILTGGKTVRQKIVKK